MEMGAGHQEEIVAALPCSCGGATKLAYTLREWARACSVSEAEVKEAVSTHELAGRRTKSGHLIVLGEDGAKWLRDMPPA